MPKDYENENGISLITAKYLNPIGGNGYAQFENKVTWICTFLKVRVSFLLVFRRFMFIFD